MILCDEKYPPILGEILAELSDDAVELVFVRSEEMREINKNERGIDKTTDVLSFPLENVPFGGDIKLIGSVVINLDLVEQKSLEFSHSNDDEIALLFTHGLLHILGFDHEIDNGQMREKECEIITKFKLPKSLIVRTLE
ncbi:MULTISPECIES: rRNA maturation RNase YbeY [unclassified Campylobacter]|uniref:rRNA maturation RNase YbeY n=1 Tax=unclassified Campylobacter TaxID=2593542 RepID=UPI0022E9D48C|nr:MULTISPECIES: rRNA maturation RNase YbeY [unclassified Campylobacter]MDA3079760.1 rRNA maturation RNase YbeY [Campylobacter sp. CS_NA2]MDA3081480.1 rRNA maturation RNase YbeY [Campylobacter sp. CS_NA1]MDA3085857.1 rRNA maturation RNase YbeY [Campylobacter sp. CS_ED1]WBR52012.1 rRNA maturation RNase YbeY [Campylobacter sp. CS_NA3]